MGRSSRRKKESKGSQASPRSNPQTEYPDWFLENLKVFEAFNNLDDRTDIEREVADVFATMRNLGRHEVFREWVIGDGRRVVGNEMTTTYIIGLLVLSLYVEAFSSKQPMNWLNASGLQ
jgi:hypothetical protein